MLQVDGLCKAFGDFRAVNGASLTVRPGDLVAVIGPNGAGKTTLFNLITGHLQADRGSIRFRGEEISRLPAHEICRRGIARSFQIANIFPRLSVFENVQVAVLSAKGLSRSLFRPTRRLVREETEGILDRVGLLNRRVDLAGSLSHGDKRILEIAIALGNEPRLLILDEPTAGMSPEETAATLALIRRLAREEGLTILFCEHDMEVVFNVATSIMVMQHGSTLIQGPPPQVRADPAVQEAYLGRD
ncbi:MAG: ABC transporter ATP-binding protein [Desulfobacterales bacterium]